MRFFLILLLVPVCIHAEDPGIDPTTGLVMDKDWELVVANCVQCHSPKQFLRQRGTRSTWQSVVDWMQQKEQGLSWLADPETEAKIVAYLAKNYAPDPGNYRRAPIPPTLLPENPYVSKARQEYLEKKAKGVLPPGGTK